MAGSQASLTNRKLGYARTQLNSLNNAQQLSPPDFNAASCALEAGLVFVSHAYMSLLAEIADAYNHKGLPISTLGELTAALDERGLAPSELILLERLESTDSWLSSVIQSRALLHSVADKDLFRLNPNLAMDSEISTNAIQLVDANDEQSWEDKLAISIAEMTALVDTIRESISEY